MFRRRLLALAGLLLLSGCLYGARERADEAVGALAAQPFDLAPPAEVKPAASASAPAPAKKAEAPAVGTMDVETTAYMQATGDQPPPGGKRRLEPPIPAEIPGSETPLLKLPKDPAERQRAIRRIYPELPPLPDRADRPLPGPDGHPYTLADLQQLAAANSPQLRQAACDVEAARGQPDPGQGLPQPHGRLERAALQRRQHRRASRGPSSTRRSRSPAS